MKILLSDADGREYKVHVEIDKHYITISPNPPSLHTEQPEITLEIQDGDVLLYYHDGLYHTDPEQQGEPVIRQVAWKAKTGKVSN